MLKSILKYITSYNYFALLISISIFIQNLVSFLYGVLPLKVALIVTTGKVPGFINTIFKTNDPGIVSFSILIILLFLHNFKTFLANKNEDWRNRLTANKLDSDESLIYAKQLQQRLKNLTNNFTNFLGDFIYIVVLSGIVLFLYPFIILVCLVSLFVLFSVFSFNAGLSQSSLRRRKKLLQQQSNTIFLLMLVAILCDYYFADLPSTFSVLVSVLALRQIIGKSIGCYNSFKAIFNSESILHVMHQVNTRKKVTNLASEKIDSGGVVSVEISSICQSEVAVNLYSRNTSSGLKIYIGKENDKDILIKSYPINRKSLIKQERFIFEKFTKFKVSEELETKERLFLIYEMPSKGFMTEVQLSDDRYLLEGDFYLELLALESNELIDLYCSTNTTFLERFLKKLEEHKLEIIYGLPEIKYDELVSTIEGSLNSAPLLIHPKDNSAKNCLVFDYGVEVLDFSDWGVIPLGMKLSHRDSFSNEFLIKLNSVLSSKNERNITMAQLKIWYFCGRLFNFLNNRNIILAINVIQELDKLSKCSEQV
ncbi:hypothetical protein AB4341_16585 [Vibrio breoganii]